MKKIRPKIRIIIGFPFLATAAFFLAGNLRKNYLYAILFSVFHELGHICAMSWFDKIPDRIIFGIMGIRIEKSELSLSYREECITALCGPAVNLVFILIFAFLGISGLPYEINAGLFIVNMLPIKSLDGGRFIYNYLSAVTDKEKAAKVINVFEIITVLILVTVLIASLVTGFVNSSFVLFTVILVIIIASELIFDAVKIN